MHCPIHKKMRALLLALLVSLFLSAYAPPPDKSTFFFRFCRSPSIGTANVAATP